MQELDLWSEVNVIGPLLASETNPDEWESTLERVKKAIRAKVLESYRNGQIAGARPAPQMALRVAVPQRQ